MMRNPIPAKARPSANLAGLESSQPRFAIHTHTPANTGAKMMMNAELIDWNHGGRNLEAADRALGEVAREQIERRRRLLERGPEDRGEHEQHEDHDARASSRRVDRPPAEKMYPK